MYESWKDKMFDDALDAMTEEELAAMDRLAEELNDKTK